MVGEVNHGNDSRSYEEVILDVNFGRLLETMKFELDFMHANQVWTFVDPIKDIIPVRCKWVFKRKISKKIMALYFSFCM